MIPRVEPEGMLVRKPVSTPDQVRRRLFRDLLSPMNRLDLEDALCIEAEEIRFDLRRQPQRLNTGHAAFERQMWKVGAEQHLSPAVAVHELDELRGIRFRQVGG